MDDPGFANPRVLRATASPTKAGDWALVLTAAGIHHHVDERDGQFALLVAVEDEPRAQEALTGFDDEGAPEQAPPVPDRGPSPLGVLVAATFGAMFAVTALTLHADLLHLAGNVIASLIFVAAVGRWLGAGLGGALLLGSATAANLLTAAVHRTAFDSVGGSTATFAALGLCAGLQVVRRLKLRTRR